MQTLRTSDDWIEWCISNPIVIVFNTLTEITYVVLEFATIPLRFGLVLSAHCLDWFWSLFVRTSNFCWSIFGVFVTPFEKPLQHLAEVVPSGLGKVLPEEVVKEAQGFKDLILVEFRRIASLGASEQLQELGYWKKREAETKSATMMSVVGGQAVANKLSNVTGNDPGPDDGRRDWTTDYTASAVYGVSRVVWQYLAGDDGSKAVSELLTFNAVVAQELAVTEDAQKASAAQGHSAVLGTYDAAGSKTEDISSKWPGPLKKCMMPVLVCYASLFGSGLLFSLIRFSLYGLH
ncbi:hypothetical protein R1sor_015367 [Riccia sorocarpa]|uniref:Uncharacterized protein n=1 Tax=Riccia sorocarpa TaxID=122646 RepID=A0ABD3HC06_9MARC